MYLPAMAIYALLPPESATAAYIGLHIANRAGALRLRSPARAQRRRGSRWGASFAFAWVAPAGGHLVIFFPVAIWLIVALVGVELAVRAGTWAARLGAGCWPPSRSADSRDLARTGVVLRPALVIGGWIAYRILLIPEHPSPLKVRLSSLLLTSLAVFGIGIGLSAAGCCRG